MTNLLYREDMDAVRERLTTWWNGGDIGRPAMMIYAPRTEPLEDIPALPTPPGWLTNYSITNYAYRVNLFQRACINTHYLGEAVPHVSPDLAPNCLALFLGCEGIDEPGSVWCRPCMDSPEEARFDFDPENRYWDFSLRLGQEMLRWGKEKFMIQFPDLIEGLDTLSAMRGNQSLLVDLIERPDWVKQCLRQITDRYFHCYDILYDLYRDEVGGSFFWCWAPGRMAKFQCDMSAMIGPEMFREFMVPVLTEMCERVSYSMYHWDGPGALRHLDCLLSVPKLDMIQWTPGAGQETTDHPKWWPYYHRILEGGKKVYAHTVMSAESLKAMKREFGDGLKQFLLCMSVESPAKAEEILGIAEVN